MNNAVKFADAKSFHQKGQNTKAIKHLIGDLALEVKTNISGTFVSFAIVEQADEAIVFLKEGGWSCWKITDTCYSVGMD